MPKCILCGYGGKKRPFVHYQLDDDIDASVCDPCWDVRDGDVKEEILAKVRKKRATRKKATKKKATKKKAVKKSAIQPCKWCGRVDFKNDHARRGHQGKCSKNPSKPPPLNRPAAKKRQAKKEARAKTTTPPPPSGDKKEKDPKRVAAGKKARRKGGKFELYTKKYLALWYGEDSAVTCTKESQFIRTPGSGGQSDEWPLDLIVPKDFPWAVECKNVELPGGMEAMERFFTVEDYALPSWFKTAEEELVNANVAKPLLLVCTRNQFPAFAVLRRPSKGDIHYMFPFKHMTLCDLPFGELVVALLDDLLGFGLDHWNGAYQWSDAESYAPRSWE